jgi:hypothetical protein
MPWTEIVIAICSILTIVGSIFWILHKELVAIRGEINCDRIETLQEFKAVRADLRSLDARMSRIEGYITGRDSYRNGTESK